MHGSDTCRHDAEWKRGLASRSGYLISKIMITNILSTADCLGTVVDDNATLSGEKILARNGN
jgi:hypothetical protein